MRLKAKGKDGMAGGDMTPMIDIVFQLIAFFMVLVNFSEAEQNKLIHLPSSELAKPAEVPLKRPITLQVTRQGKVIYFGKQWEVSQSRAELGGVLANEREFMKNRGEETSDATIVIRADGGAKMGVIQKIITICQDNYFEKFVFKAKQEKKKS